MYRPNDAMDVESRRILTVLLLSVVKSKSGGVSS